MGSYILGYSAALECWNWALGPGLTTTCQNWVLGLGPAPAQPYVRQKKSPREPITAEQELMPLLGGEWTRGRLCLKSVMLSISQFFPVQL